MFLMHFGAIPFFWYSPIQWNRIIRNFVSYFKLLWIGKKGRGGDNFIVAFLNSHFLQDSWFSLTCQFVKLHKKVKNIPVQACCFPRHTQTSAYYYRRRWEAADTQGKAPACSLVRCGVLWNDTFSGICSELDGWNVFLSNSSGRL